MEVEIVSDGTCRGTSFFEVESGSRFLYVNDFVLSAHSSGPYLSAVMTLMLSKETLCAGTTVFGKCPACEANSPLEYSRIPHGEEHEASDVRGFPGVRCRNTVILIQCPYCPQRSVLTFLRRNEQDVPS